MKKTVIYFLIISLLIIGLLSNSVTAQPTVEEITFDPSGPVPLSTITFTANISGDNVSEVYITVIECKGDLCFFPKINESMAKIDNDTYQADVALNHDDADNIGYWLVIRSDGTWYDFQDSAEELDLSTTSDNGNGKSTNGTPGFELILILGAITLIMFYRKKRE